MPFKDYRSLIQAYPYFTFWMKIMPCWLLILKTKKAIILIFSFSFKKFTSRSSIGCIACFFTKRFEDVRFNVAIFIASSEHMLRHILAMFNAAVFVYLMVCLALNFILFILSKKWERWGLVIALSIEPKLDLSYT